MKGVVNDGANKVINSQVMIFMLRKNRLKRGLVFISVSGGVSLYVVGKVGGTHVLFLRY